VIALSCCLAFCSAQDPLVLELRTPRREYYVQESIPVELRLGVEQEFLERQMLQPFRRQLDLPLILEASWLPAAAAPQEEDFIFALNGSEAGARLLGAEQRNGHAWSFYAYSAILRADAAGELDLPAAALRYTIGTDFADDPIQGRIAAGRQDRVIAAVPLRLTILPLPAAGRPADFSGAVGQFSVAAAAEPTDLALGEALTLTLLLRGDAPAASYPPPDLSALSGFDLLGQLDDRAAPVRTVRYELRPRAASVRSIPVIDFAYFDPAPPAAYRIAQTAEIPLRVRGGEGAAPAVAAAGPLLLLPVREQAPPPPRLHPAAFLLALLLPAALTGGAWQLLRRREQDRRDPLAARSRRAAARFREDLAHDPERCAAHLAEYLAARLRLPAGAVVAPDLLERLQASGLTADSARAAVDTLEQLVAARYGGPACADGAERARVQVRELERHFAGGTRP
jgi:hypothetical protein